MKSIDLNNFYASQIEKIMSETGLGQEFSAEVKNCTNIHQIFETLSGSDAKHVALLTKSAEPIENSLDYIKSQLAKNKPVALAVFHEKEIQLH